DLLKQRHLAEHQYIAVLHRDATYPGGSMRPHVHLVINLVNSTGEVANVWWDYPKTEKVLRHLEKCYGLTSVPCSWEVAKRSNSKGQIQRLARETAEFLAVDHPRIQKPQPSVRQLLQQAVDKAVVNSTSIGELTKALQSRGVVSNLTSQGIRYELNGIHFAGYQLGESYTLKVIELQLRLQQKRKAQQQWEQRLTALHSESSPSLSSQASLPQSVLAQRDKEKDKLKLPPYSLSRSPGIFETEQQEYEKRMSQLQQRINFVASRVAYSLITANTTQDSVSTPNATYTMTWDDATKELRLYCSQPDDGDRLFPILLAEYDYGHQQWIGKGVVSHYLNESHLTDWASFVTTPELLNLPHNRCSHPIMKAMESSVITTNQMTTNQTEQVLPLSSSQLQVQSPFDSIKHIDDQGCEYWLARELMELLGYKQYRRFADAIERAILSQENAGNSIREDFLPEVAKTSGRPQEDYKLSRYACYLVAMNGDPRKTEIAQAQAYFVVKTREAETIIPQQNDELEALRLQARIAEAQANAMRDQRLVLESGASIVSLHGAGMLALIQGRPEAVVRETEIQFESVVMNEDGKQLAVFRGKSLAQLGKELKFKTGKEFQKWLESCGKDHLICKAMRPVQTDYIPAEAIDQIRELWANRKGDRQLVIGE
ncbi:BRO family protein, partial [Planktothrix tepida]